MTRKRQTFEPKADLDQETLVKLRPELATEKNEEVSTASSLPLSLATRHTQEPQLPNDQDRVSAFPTDDLEREDKAKTSDLEDIAIQTREARLRLERKLAQAEGRVRQAEEETQRARLAEQRAKEEARQVKETVATRTTREPSSPRGPIHEELVSKLVRFPRSLLEEIAQVSKSLGMDQSTFIRVAAKEKCERAVSSSTPKGEL